MNDESEGLAQSILGRLEEGAAPDTVIDELVARGLSRPTAERFLDRALDEMASTVVKRHGDAPTSGGGIRWAWIATAVLCLVAAGTGFVGYRKWQAAQEEEARRAARARAELAAADRARATEIRAESRARREREQPLRGAAVSIRLDQTLEKLRSDNPLWQCEAAMHLKQFGSRDHVRSLLEAVGTARHHSVRACALSAMSGLGETTIPMQVYIDWSRSQDPDERGSAVSGFGEIGPAAAGAALPFLGLELKSSHWDRRFVVVESLAKLGVAARPLLTEASHDEDARVRDRAAAVLKMTN